MKKFILLKDNRIIDTQKYIIFEEETLYGDAYFNNKKNGQLCYIIRKQEIAEESDNLIDLIRIDDLVGLNVLTVEKLNYKNVIAVGKEFLYFIDNTSAHISDVMRILKPNEIGGYDLAWKKEMEL